MNNTSDITSSMRIINDHLFDEQHTLHELRHYLPSQTPLKDFIHHNSLHAFQHMKFYDAIFRASKLFGYQVTLQLKEFRQLYKRGRIKDEILQRVIRERRSGSEIALWKEKLISGIYDDHNDSRIGKLRAHWKNEYQFDLDTAVQTLLFRILCSYLDQGISVWNFPVHEKGFLESIKDLEKNSFTSFFKFQRARKLLLHGYCSIPALLKILVGDERYYSQYLFDQQFSHRGWSGMVATVEAEPNTLLNTRKISLHDLIVFELLLEIDAMDNKFGKNWQPLATIINEPPLDIFEVVPKDELHEVFKLWQDAFEWSYYDEVLAGIQTRKKAPHKTTNSKSFQAMFCIDERECSLRRHIESVDKDCETFGTPGFFSVEFYYQPENGSFYDKLCPAPVTPKYLIKEYDVKMKRKHELLYTNKTHHFFTGFLGSLTFGFYALMRMISNLFSPKMSPAISNAFSHLDKDAKLTIENTDMNHRENDLQVGFTVSEMAVRVESLLRGIGLIGNFSPLIYVIAHGSSSANNPHHGAHDCGACSGRPGSVNARVFAFMANHPGTRLILKEKGIDLPEETQFVGGLHDTAGDEIEYYDLDVLNEKNKKAHQLNATAFEEALDLNAKERSRRFASIKTRKPLSHVRKEIKKRSVSLFEPRPELGHGTNSLCIVARRDLTKGLFLDRRAFLNSYDYRTDPEGKLLTGIMKPLGPVCGGINLEYYFSRVDNYKLGADTKLPHNVMGLFGVTNSSDGDLRPGLPLQMIEVHDPVRLLIIVEHYPQVVLNTIQSVPEMYEWFINEWVHLAVLHPEDGLIYYFKEGSFISYETVASKINAIDDLHHFIENAKEMETNNIIHATEENLPVHLYN